MLWYERVCLTSSNLSKAAWGELQKGQSQLMIRNYELGVLFLPSKIRKRNGQQGGPTTTFRAGDEPKVEDSEVTFPLPYKIPPQRYTRGQDEPWVWDLSRTQKDIFGNTWRTGFH